MTTETVATAVMAAMRMICVGVVIAIPKSCARPALTCWAPIPSDVATPVSVAMIASTSITSPVKPQTRSPSSGCSSERKLSGILRLNPKYANASPTMAYSAHGCSPQWKIVTAIAMRDLSSPSASPGGVELK